MYLSLCLIIKDENSYLQEWLDYHILLGVEHFWVYDNESTVPVAETLKSYIQSGWVTVNCIEGRKMQLAAYDHCIQTYGLHSKWIGFIDTDEFIVLREAKSLREYLLSFEPYGGLAISSLFFGSGGNKTRPAGGQIAGYLFRTSEQFWQNRLVKMIIQPEKVLYPISPHSFLFNGSNYCVNEAGWRVDAQQYPCHIDNIQVNHYFTRSDEEWAKKHSRGGGAGIRYTDNNRSEVNQYASIKDTLILKRLQEILPDAPIEAVTWQRATLSNSPRFLNLLHQSAKKHLPAPLQKQKSLKVTPRPDLIQYHKEVAIGLRLLEEKRITEAYEFFASQITKFPWDVIRYTNFGKVSLQKGDFETAWTAIAQAWRMAPKSLYVLLCMTDYFYTIKDFAQAEKTSLLAAALGDLEPIGVAILALSQWKQGKHQEAISTAQPVLAHLPEDQANNPVYKELVTLIPKKGP